MSEAKRLNESDLSELLLSISKEDRDYALHFKSAVDEGIGFSIPRNNIVRLLDMGLIERKDDGYYEETDLLLRAFPTLLKSWNADYAQ